MTHDSSDFHPRQTINGLLVQMHRADLDESGLQQVLGAHALATAMFNGQYRGTGKPFLCHLVGTASAVMKYDGNLDLVLAGLLHAAFDFGVFPDGRTGKPSSAHKRWLMHKAGERVTTLIERFHRFPFNSTDVQRLVAKDTTGDRDMILLRLCNELDDLTDGGLAFAAKRGSSTLPNALDCETLASRIGVPQLGARIVQLAKECDAMDWAATLATGKNSYRVAPRFLDYLNLRLRRMKGKRVEMLHDH